MKVLPVLIIAAFGWGVLLLAGLALLAAVW
mgnify:CR=1 FL=1